MTKEIWLNLPVKDVSRAKEFFSKIGFNLNEKQTNAEVACFEIGEQKTTVLFISEETFKGFTRDNLPASGAGAEVLISFDSESREEVDEMARRVFEAGGKIFAEPAEIHGWMYGFGFADPDEHRWNMMYMDFSQMPQQAVSEGA